jgi:general secretion pathway protein H
LAVLAILAIAAMITLPRVAGTRDTAAWRATVQQLAAALTATRNAAVASSAERQLILDIAARRYWAEGAFPPRALPPSVALACGLNSAPVECAAFTFHADGSTRGGWIDVRQGHRVARVSIDWLTGATHIDWGS